MQYGLLNLVGLCFPLVTGVSTWSLALAFVTYILGMFGVTAGYHRYFSHRTFKTSRAFAFVLAFLAQATGQKGVIWWARNHRHHHRYSDKPEDLHSPILRGFWYSHFIWVFDDAGHRKSQTVSDLERVPELVWLDENWLVPPLLTGLFYWQVFGLEGAAVGFFFTMILLHHGTFTINSLTHVWGSRTYDTPDSSRNNFWLALITLGEGWHNNHHYYMRSTRQGFEWWQIDITYMMLRGLARLGIVWDLREPPPALLRQNRIG